MTKFEKLIGLATGEVNAIRRPFHGRNEHPSIIESLRKSLGSVPKDKEHYWHVSASFEDSRQAHGYGWTLDQAADNCLAQQREQLKERIATDANKVKAQSDLLAKLS